MAQVIERGSGRYLVRVFLGRDPSTGKRNYHNKTIRGTKKQAEAYGRKIQHEVDTGVFREAAHQTVGEYLDHWMEHTAHRKVRPRTLEGYEDVLRLHVRPVVGDVPMGSLSPQDVERIVTTMEAKGRSPQTIRNALTPLRHALNHAVKHGTIPQNPATADLVDLPKKVQRKVDTLTAEEAKGFVEAAKGERWGALYVVLLGGGMRPGEALGLKWDDFDGKAVRIDRALVRARNGRDWRLRETKTAKSRRTVPLPGFAVNALKEFRRLQAEDKLQAGSEWNETGLIFVDEKGEPLRWRSLARATFRNILTEADLPDIRPYDLRHTCASLLLAAGVNPKIVSERLGHSTVALTLDTYSSVLPGLQEEATAKLGELLG
jgi:integrase